MPLLPVVPCWRCNSNESYLVSLALGRVSALQKPGHEILSVILGGSRLHSYPGFGVRDPRGSSVHFSLWSRQAALVLDTPESFG